MPCILEEIIMLVNEIYGLYYYAVSEVLDAALQKARLENGLSQNDVAKIIEKNTFDDIFAFGSQNTIV